MRRRDKADGKAIKAQRRKTMSTNGTATRKFARMVNVVCEKWRNSDTDRASPKLAAAGCLFPLSAYPRTVGIVK
jgi:hypothetical protein